MREIIHLPSLFALAACILCLPTFAGTDYNVNTGDPSSRKFTVIFISRQANSTENIILIADDEIFEGRECFRLRICVIRFIGQAAQFFRAQHGVNNTFIDICIEDDDSKYSS